MVLNLSEKCYCNRNLFFYLQDSEKIFCVFALPENGNVNPIGAKSIGKVLLQIEIWFGFTKLRKDFSVLCNLAEH